MFIHTSAAEVT